MKKFLNVVFIVLIAALILTGLSIAIIKPTDINEYENRYNNKLALPSFKTFYNGEFQDLTEKALADQLLFAVKAKEIYNKSFSFFNQTVLGLIFPEKIKEETEEASIETVEEEEFKTISDPNARYVKLASGRQILNGHLMYETRFLDGEKESLDKRIENINSTIEKFPDLEFLIYYIEKETDINFVTGERSGIFEYIQSNVNLPEENVNRFNITKFEDFDKWFYLTDHHLNYKGAQECYTRLLSWLLPAEKPLQPEGIYRIGYYSGSKATGKDANNYRDINTCYKYNYPEVTTYEKGKKIGYYGAQEYYIGKVAKNNGELLNKVTYGQLFGQDSGEVIIENAANENGSILMFGDSMDNILLRLLSAHYTKIYSIDLRNYNKHMGKAFNLKTYLKNHPDIEEVLFIGNLDLFVQDSFNLK